MPFVSSAQDRWVVVRSYLRRNSQMTAFVIGLAMAIGGAFAWYFRHIGPISGSLFLGIGSSIVAAAIVAYLSPFSEAAYRRFISLGIDEVWPSRDAIQKRCWVDWMNAAVHNCVLLGIAHGGWCQDERFPPALRDALERGVRIKIFFLDPNIPAAELRSQEEEKKRDTGDAIRESIEFVWNFRKELKAGIRPRLRIYAYNATPSCGLTWIDDFMIVTHYLAGLPNSTSPTLRVNPPHIGIEPSLYDRYAVNLETTEDRSVELDERNIENYLPRKPKQPEHGNAIRRE